MKVTTLFSKYIQCLLNPNRPWFAHYFVTTQCNLRCSYCGIWRKDYSQHENTKLSKRIIDKIDSLGVMQLSFTGGEPLLRDDICELINYASDKGLWTQITSNGTMTEEKYEALAKSKIDFVSISLDSIEESANRQKGSDVAKVVSTIDFLVNKGVKPNIACTISHNNLDINKIEEMLQFAKSMDCKIMLCPAVIQRRNNAEYGLRIQKSRYDEEKVKELFKFLRGSRYRCPLMTTPQFLDMAEKYMLGTDTWRCKAGRRFFDVMVDGTFGFCQDKWWNDQKNILVEDFDSWWTTNRYDDSCIISASCEGCIYGCYPNTEILFTRHAISTFFMLLGRGIF